MKDLHQPTTTTPKHTRTQTHTHICMHVYYTHVPTHQYVHTYVHAYTRIHVHTWQSLSKVSRCISLSHLMSGPYGRRSSCRLRWGVSTGREWSWTPPRWDRRVTASNAALLCEVEAGNGKKKDEYEDETRMRQEDGGMGQ